MKVFYELLILLYLSINIACSQSNSTIYLGEYIKPSELSALKLIDFINYQLYENEDIKNSDRIIEKYKNKISKGEYYFYKSWIMFLGNNLKLRMSYLIKADEFGNNKAGEQIYQDMQLLNVDLKTAIKYLKSSADKGNSSAQFTLGIRWLLNDDVKIKENGVLLLEKSALNGNANALEKLSKEEILVFVDKPSKQFWRVISLLKQETAPSFKKAGNILKKIKKWDVFCKKFNNLTFDLYDKGFQLRKETLGSFELILDKCLIF